MFYDEKGKLIAPPREAGNLILTRYIDQGVSIELNGETVFITVQHIANRCVELSFRTRDKVTIKRIKKTGCKDTPDG